MREHVGVIMVGVIVIMTEHIRVVIRRHKRIDIINFYPLSFGRGIFFRCVTGKFFLFMEHDYAEINPACE